MGDVTLPREVREAVIRELYRQVEAIGWEAMTHRQKTQQYARWVDDPEIGGELADYFTAEGMRVWLKDIPLKEYARALEGVGAYAEFASKRLTPPAELVRQALGPAWGIVPGSKGEKPMHCLATDGSTERYICWGRPGTFRDLIWAAVNAAVDLSTRPMIAVFIRDDSPIDDRERERHELIASYCSVDLRYVRRRLVDREATPPGQSAGEISAEK